MASEREQFRVLINRGDIKAADVPQALMDAGIAPDLGRWRGFIDNLLLWLGASAMAAGVLFFVAYNWEEMGRFAKFGLVQSLMVIAIGAYVFLARNERLAKASLFVASVLLGVLLALYGQTYQTGADPWELFATWAALMLPWTLIARFAPLWLLFTGLLNVAWLTYTDTFRPALGTVANYEQTALLGVFLLNGLALFLWERRLPHHGWLQDLWSPRLLALAVGIPATLLAIIAVTTSRGPALLYVALWAAFIGMLVWFYRHRRADLFMLAGVCFSGGALVMALLIEHVFDNYFQGGGQFLLMAVLIIAMGTGSAVWLRRTQRDLFKESQ